MKTKITPLPESTESPVTVITHYITGHMDHYLTFLHMCKHLNQVTEPLRHMEITSAYLA